MREVPRSLAGCSDAASLNRAIQELCTEAGVVARIDIRTMARAGKRQALCFLRVDPASQEVQLMRTPGLIRFGNDLLLVVDLAGSEATGCSSTIPSC